jgi:hypothetical protein
MIPKLLQMGAYDTREQPRLLGVCGDGPDFVKTADLDDPFEMTPEMKDFWYSPSTVKKPEEYMYLLINIVGAGEYWGSNFNGDFFPEVALVEYHKTFMNAYPFVRHKNKDPKFAVGTRILFSTYNDAPWAKRTEVIAALKRGNPGAEEFISKVDKGIMPNVSMGCRVPYDQCNVCGNKARTKKEYCVHAKEHMNKLWEGRIRCFVINRHPYFFDVSLVDIPAEAQTGTLAKVAHVQTYELMGSAEAYENLGWFEMVEPRPEKTAKVTSAAMTKGDEAPVDDEEMLRAIVATLEKEKGLLDEGSESISGMECLPEQAMERLASYPIDQIMDTATALRMLILPQEHTFLVNAKMASMEAARLMYRNNQAHSFQAPMSTRRTDYLHNFNEKVASILLPFVELRSVTKPLGMVKKASRRGVEFVSGPADSAYPSYLGSLGRENPHELFYVLEDLELGRKLASVYGGEIAAFNFDKNASAGLTSLARMMGAARTVLSWQNQRIR